MNDVKKRIEQRLRAYDPDIKFTSSSALTDLMINPIAAIISPIEDDINVTTREQSLQEPEAMTEAAMDRYASNFHVTRDLGARATGFVRIYFKSARTLYLDAGVYFETADGKRFNLNAAYSITESQMAANVTDWPKVSTGLIAVTAANYGSTNETDPNTVTKAFGLSVDYAYVKNPVGITGGVIRETNTQLNNRIDSSAINKSISADRGIQTIIMNNFTSITDVVIKGRSDAEMKRDLVYTTPGGELLSNLPSNFYLSDFFGALSGIQEPPANRSRGYWGVFYVEVPAGSGIQTTDIPSPANFTDEWTNVRYTSLYKVSDSFYQTVNTDFILAEYFAGGTADNETWVESDGSTLDGRVLATDEIEIEAGLVRLGKTYNTTTNNNRIWVKPNDKQRILDILDEIAVKPPKGKGTANEEDAT